jgi:hypothetical protein
MQKGVVVLKLYGLGLETSGSLNNVNFENIYTLHIRVCITSARYYCDRKCNLVSHVSSQGAQSPLWQREISKDMSISDIFRWLGCRKKYNLIFSQKSVLNGTKSQSSKLRYNFFFWLGYCVATCTEQALRDFASPPSSCLRWKYNPTGFFLNVFFEAH